jgi:hypothetical protein
MARKGFDTTLAHICYIISRLPDALTILIARLISIFEQADSYWTRKKVAERLNSSVRYHYMALTSPRQIRLLRILRRKPGHGLQCELVHVDLDNRPGFEAISYTWRRQNSTENIILDGRRLAVTLAVYEIAKYLQSFTKEKFLWIDAVCINQPDMDEKNIQVPLTKDIFLHAFRVILWLGPQDQVEDAHLARRFLCQLAYSIVKYDTDRGKFLDDLRDRKDPGLPAAIKLFSHPWFSRTWVLQEMAVAKNLAVVYGTICLDWPLVEFGIEIMLDPYTVGFTLMEYRLIELHDRFRYLRTARFMTAVRQHFQSNQGISLGLLLGKSIALEATDLRDKIFALLGLLTVDFYQSLAPDYRTPLADVYLDVMCRLLGSNDPFDGRTALQFAGIGYPRSPAFEEQNPPSWVSDWSYDVPGRSLWLEAGFTIPNDGKELVYVRSRSYDDKRILGLQGVRLDTMQYLGSICDLLFMTEDPFEYLRLVRTWLLEGISMVNKHLVSGEDAPQTQRSVEQFFGYFLWSTRPPHTSDHETHLELTKFLENINDVLNQKHHVVNSKQKRSCLGLAMAYVNTTDITGKRFCITEEGRMALVPSRSKVGDILADVVGMNMPLAFRHHSPDGIYSSDKFQLVGCCRLGEVDNLPPGKVPGWILVV